MSITVVRGKVSHIARGSDLSYAATNQGPVAIQNQLVSLRLDGKPVQFRSRSLVSFSEGDDVAAAGKDKNGTFEATAMRNLTTGALYAPPIIFAGVLAILLIVLGVPLIAFLGFGLLFVGFGAWVLYKAWMVHQSTTALKILI